MYSRPQHEEHIEPNHPLDNCIEEALLNGDTLYDCKEIKMRIEEENITIWPKGDGGTDHLPHCSKILIIDADTWFSQYSQPIAIIDSITELIWNCDEVQRIIIVGEHKAMSGFKVVNNKCKKEANFSAWISGINVLRAIRRRPNDPLVVACITSRGKGPTLDVTRTYYV